MLNCFLLLFSFTGVISAPVIPQIITDMKNDTECNASRFLYDSKYTDLCTSLKYTDEISELTGKTLNNFLCLGVHDTAYKICQHSSQQTSFNYTLSFNSYMENLISDDNEEFKENSQQEFCKNLTGFTSLYNKTSSYMKTLITNLSILNKCQKICFDFNNNLHPLCAVLGWIKSVENKMKKPNHDSIASTQFMNRLYDDLPNDKTTGANIKSKEKEIEEQNKKETTIDSKNDINNKIKQSNMSSTNTKPFEKGTFNLEGSITDKTQKTVDNISIKAGKEKNTIDNKSQTNVEAAQFSKIMPANNDVSPKNNGEINVPKKDVNEEKSEDLKKKQNIDDVKTSTLSENTQDHYLDTNLEEEMETGDMNGIYIYNLYNLFCNNLYYLH